MSGRQPLPEGEPQTEAANPFADHSSFKSAALSTGFSLDIAEPPLSLAPYLIQTLGRDMVQVFYGNDEVLIRKARGEDRDISGDYTHYPDIQTVEAGGNAILIKGRGRSFYLALWSADGFSFALRVEAGLAPQEIAALAASIS